MPQYPDTNKTLIDKVRNGDDISWYEFYDQYAEVILAIGKVANLNEADCKDLVQCVMNKFFQYSKTFSFTPGLSKFRTYFHSIVRSQISEIIKFNCKKIPQNELQTTDIEISITEKIDITFMAKWQECVFKDALKTLAKEVEEKTYLSFSMTTLEQLSIPEVAKFLQISNDNVYVNRYRCINKLKKIIAEYKSDDPLLDIEEDFDV